MQQADPGGGGAGPAAQGVQQLRVGIMGTANIARKNARAMHLSRRCALVAVASRSLSKAEAFAAEVKAAKAYGSYDDLLADVDVDAIYLPLPTMEHVKWVRLCAEAGKHVLLEKPVSVTMEDLDEMAAVCASHSVVLLDGLMFHHHDRLARLVRELQDPFCGQVRSVHSSFSFRGDAEFLKSNIRVTEDGDPLGALGDLGYYNVRLSLLAVNAARGLPLGEAVVPSGPLSLPSRVYGTCTAWAGAHSSVPIECQCRLEWEGDGGATATFDCSFLSAFRQHFEIVCLGGGGGGLGDKIFTCRDFVIPQSPSACSFEVEVIPTGFPGTDHACRIVTSRDVITVADCQQELLMFEEFARLAQDERGGASPRAQAWLEWTRATQAVVCALRESMRQGGAAVRPAAE